MNSTPSLNGAHLRTYDTIFQHPISHNLNWRAVRALLSHLGQVVEEPNGNLKVTRNKQILFLHQPRTKDVVAPEGVVTLRHFLEQSETIPRETDEDDAHWLLVIDHHEARVFRSKIPGAAFQRVRPQNPAENLARTRDSGDVSRGKEIPSANSFFEPIAAALQGAGEILIFGTGTGTSDEMNQFIAWLKIHEPPMAERIAALVVNEPHLTNDQLIAKARDFFAKSSKSAKQ